MEISSRHGLGQTLSCTCLVRKFSRKWGWFSRQVSTARPRKSYKESSRSWVSGRTPGRTDTLSQNRLYFHTHIRLWWVILVHACTGYDLWYGKRHKIGKQKELVYTILSYEAKPLWSSYSCFPLRSRYAARYGPHTPLRKEESISSNRRSWSAKETPQRQWESFRVCLPYIHALL